MTTEQRDLCVKAQENLAAAKVLASAGFPGFAASRAYFTMYYVARACLLGQVGLGFTGSEDADVLKAFSEHFCKTRKVPAEFQEYLAEGLAVRNMADYGRPRQPSVEETTAAIARATEFCEAAMFHVVLPSQLSGGHHHCSI
jgi:uncharacterized protein (UPF0332 family)